MKAKEERRAKREGIRKGNEVITPGEKVETNTTARIHGESF